jgi:hypothetical protein
MHNENALIDGCFVHQKLIGTEFGQLSLFSFFGIAHLVPRRKDEKRPRGRKPLDVVFLEPS